MKIHPKHTQTAKDQKVQEERTDHNLHRKKRLSDQIWNLGEFSDDDSIDSIRDYDNKDDNFIPSKEHKTKKAKREI